MMTLPHGTTDAGSFAVVAIWVSIQTTKPLHDFNEAGMYKEKSQHQSWHEQESSPAFPYLSISENH